MMLPAVVYAKLHRVPLTTYVLDLWPENLYSVLPVKNKTLRAVAAGVSHWFYRRSNRLIAMSEGLAQTLRAIAPKAQIAVVPQYCEDFYAQDVVDDALQRRFAGRFNVLFAGNISPAQNLELLVACAQKLKQENRSDIHFVIVGDGMSRAALEQSIDEADVAELFTFEGQHPVTDIPAYHTMADALFAALAKSADLGLTVPAKITSYLAAGRPCLVSVDGEAARVVQEAGCGLTCAAGDVDALYQNLLRLAAMPAQERANMGHAGRAYYQRYFRRAPLLKQLEHFILYGDDGINTADSIL
jgi:glycosyltransferase involved in cell wall biosynthesis